MIVFVHGVPETAEIWDGLRAAVDPDAGSSVALSLPGFASPRDFEPTKEAYAAWLAEELALIDEPVDLVGHDWGALLSLGVVLGQDRLVRSWVVDVANILHPDAEWHDLARTWQTPGDGEAFFEAALAASPADRAALIEGSGAPASAAATMAAAMDETMAASILGLYRSAVPNPSADWPPAPVAAPGMVLQATKDPFGDADKAMEVAGTLGASVARLEGLGHWWMVEDPAGAAEVLRRFWAGVEA